MGHHSPDSSGSENCPQNTRSSALLLQGLLGLVRPPGDSTSIDDLLYQLAEVTVQLLGVPVCLIWLLDKDLNGYVLRYHRAPDLSDLDGDRLFLPCADDAVSTVIDQPSSSTSFLPSALSSRDWRPLLAAPLVAGTRTIGILATYHATSAATDQTPASDVFDALCHHASLAIDSLERQRALAFLVRALERLSDIADEQSLLECVLASALQLTGSSRGWLSLFNVHTGQLEVKARSGEQRSTLPVILGAGVTGKALSEGTPIVVHDLRDDPSKLTAEEFWSDSRSELAVPLMIEHADVRVGAAVIKSSKPVGVLNVESPTVGAFTDTDAEHLSVLARHAAAVYERMEFDTKLSRLRDLETEIAGQRDWDLVIQTTLKGVTDTLGFERVSISLITPDNQRIRTEYLRSINAEEQEPFMTYPQHSLKAADIQADIVRTRRIEVPHEGDPRFDAAIYKRFGHEEWIRVFLPMVVSSDNRVIGTVEAAYRRHIRRQIYERDVQILKGFVDYATTALEHKRRGLLDKIGHELRAPIIGIRANASFLQRRLLSLPPETITRKFDDILTDCDILQLEVDQLRYALGGIAPRSTIQQTFVLRDIVLKTVHQLKPLLDERGLDQSCIGFTRSDLRRIAVYVDKARVSEVVFNILMNAIKYYDTREAFAVKIVVDEDALNFYVKFMDWGIGIERGLEEAVFEEGYRSPGAIRRSVSGTGLGLTISRRIMRELGGDLVLTHLRAPTEFMLTLPKYLQEKPNDSDG
jgi:signal transduction histidine kinase/putative methionine-R-sulfoxide reductase with GAF domain